MNLHQRRSHRLKSLDGETVEKLLTEDYFTLFNEGQLNFTLFEPCSASEHESEAVPASGEEAPAEEEANVDEGNKSAAMSSPDAGENKKKGITF